MTADREQTPKLPPRLFVRSAWVMHRAILRFSGGRFGLSQPAAGKKFGMMRLTTLGRRSGQPRVAIVGYYEDGPNLVTLAMNGWADAEPAWWLNLQAHCPKPASSLRSPEAESPAGERRDGAAQHPGGPDEPPRRQPERVLAVGGHTAPAFVATTVRDAAGAANPSGLPESVASAVITLCRGIQALDVEPVRIHVGVGSCDRHVHASDLFPYIAFFVSREHRCPDRPA